MEAEAEESKTSGGWSSTTNWSIADGSLVNSITVESSLSPIDDPQRPSPLILKPPATDSGSCEIKISFTQKHEVRQVYVRSTARVYEIYWAPDLHSINEYLCTVHCSVAAKDEKSLHATDIDEPDSAHVEGSDEKLADENLKNGSSVCSNGDGWVEVKALDSHPLENRSSSSQSKIIFNAGSISQDLYEATAEVSDADPCISLTLRLLSLQDKEHVYVEEIYVFVDPVESDSSDSLGGKAETQAGSSLMAMLMPTILQLSRTGLNQKEDKQMSDTRKDQRFLKFGSAATDSIKMAEKTQVEGKSLLPNQPEVGEASAEQAASSVKVFSQVPAAENMPESVAKEINLPNNQLEKVMEQLVARIGRMEYLFLRFEDSMLKPISSIEARLQRVEQQLETLTMKFNGHKVFAPEYPGNESDCNSCNEASEEPRHEALECDKVSGNINPPLPSLVVIAPEFSNGDEEENDVSEQLDEAQTEELRENDSLELARDSSRDKPKHTVSVDDALASALAGLLSSTSTRPSKYTEFLTVRAPEFPSEEDSSEDKIASQRKCTSDQISNSCNLSSLDGRGVTEENSFGHEGEENSVECGVSFIVTEENRVAVRIDDHPTTDETGNAEAARATEASSIPLSGEIYVPPIHFLGDEFDDELDAPTPLKETAEGNDLAASTRVTREQTTTKDILRDVLQFSRSPSAVDFQVPVLDVKFTQENSNTTSSLEALLTNSSDLGAPVLQVVDDGETQGHSDTTNHHLLLDVDDGYGDTGGENLQDDARTCSKDAGPFDSLI